MIALCPSSFSILFGREVLHEQVLHLSRRYKRLHLAAHKQQPLQLHHSQMRYLAISWTQAASQSRTPDLWGRRKGAGTCVRYSNPGGQLGIEGGTGIQIAPPMVGWFWTGGTTNPPGTPMGCAWNP